MSTSNGSSSSKLSLNVAISKKKSTVLFAEANGDVVDILLSFLHLTLGNIVRILEKHYGGEAPVIGSLTTLYRSSTNLLDEKILNNSTDSFQAVALVEKSASFIILSNLRVVPVVSGSLQTLNSLGIKEIEKAEITTISIDDDDIMDLLKFFLLSARPFIDFIRKKSQNKRLIVTQPESGSVFLRESHSFFERSMILKILLQKSTGRFLLAEASDDFVDSLFQILNASLGAVVSNLDDNSCFKNLQNLYDSAEFELLSKYLNFSVTTLNAFNFTLSFGMEREYIKEKGLYIIRDDLTIEPLGMTSIFSILNSSGVPLYDVKEMEFQIGPNEALRIVGASLLSTTVLTDVLINRKPENPSKQPKIEQRGPSKLSTI